MKLRRILKLSIFVLVLFVSCGCDNNTNQIIKDEKFPFKEGFNKIDILNELNLNDKEDIDAFVSNGKANIIVQETNSNNFFTCTNRIYSYDMETNKIKEITTFKKDTWVLAFTELENSYVYAYLEKKDLSSYTLKIEEVKDGKPKLITTASVKSANTDDYRPYFITQGNAVYFMLSDFIQNDESEIKLNQKFIKYENDSMNILLETKNVISTKNYLPVEPNNIIYTNRLFALSDGQILLQDFTDTSSRLLLYKDNKITPYAITTSKEYLRGFIDKYAIIFSKDEQKHYLLDFRTNERKDLEYDIPIYKALNIKDNMAYIQGSMRNDILELQDNGDFNMQLFNDKYDLMKNVDKDYSFLFIYTDGKDSFIDVTEFIDSKPVHNFYVFK
ncbi:MAG: hypothetical protein RR646_04485 [Erysipelotrichaceae bacterium]